VVRKVVAESIENLTADTVRGSNLGTLEVCKCISPNIQDSELICLIGSSGSGKSTLLRCINLLELIDDGEILLNGVDISEPDFDPEIVRRRIGVVFQSYNLFPHMSVLKDLTLGQTRVRKTLLSEARDIALTLVDRLGLADKAGNSLIGCWIRSDAGCD
jgi:polar amino acid transport system ATP-binding protein